VVALPLKNNAFEEATSWADEYKRILKLFEDNLKTDHAKLKTDH